jgi:hypothetical protein
MSEILSPQPAAPAFIAERNRPAATSQVTAEITFFSDFIRSHVRRPLQLLYCAASETGVSRTGFLSRRDPGPICTPPCH